MKKQVIQLTLLLLAYLMIFKPSFAKELSYLARSPYGLLMGDAYTARVDDEYVMFYNPAGLAMNNGVEFYPLNPEIGVTNALDDLDRFKDFPSEPSQIADRLLGFPIYVHAGGTPTIKFGPFGLSLFANINTSLILRNSVHPEMSIDYRYDRGFAFGYAYTVGEGTFFKRGGRSKTGSKTTFGLSLKSIRRDGLSEQFDLLGTKLANILSSSEELDYNTIRKELGYSKGKGWGWDLGFLQSFGTENSQLILGASILNVLDIHFRKLEGDYNVPIQEMHVNTGVTWRQNFLLMDYSVNLDFRPVLNDIPFSRKLHLGFDFGIPGIRAMAGFSEGYLSYGLRVRVWPIEVTAGFYGVEIGNEFREQKGSRAIIYISLFDFSFEA